MKLTREELQLFILRVYIGLDFIPHFAEKFGLFGADALNKVHAYFSSLHFQDAKLMLMFAGLCEFAAFIGFTFGIFTRFCAIGSATYLFISAILGHHFAFGFTWANPGGGWEYPMIWAVFCLSFVLTGGGKWSIDAHLIRHLPRSIRFLSR